MITNRELKLIVTFHQPFEILFSVTLNSHSNSNFIISLRIAPRPPIFYIPLAAGVLAGLLVTKLFTEEDKSYSLPSMY